MAWLIAHYSLILSLALSVASEVLAVIQFLKHPTNAGVGGVVVAIIKFLKQVGAQDIPPSSPQA